MNDAVRQVVESRLLVINEDMDLLREKLLKMETTAQILQHNYDAYIKERDELIKARDANDK